VTTLMVQGCTSSAGKSLVATALARCFVRRGIRVAPFKALNMANNARVVSDGEIAAAQYFQALAARVTPDTRMNPVLVKPEGDTRSQVVIRGKADLALSRLAWRERTTRLWPVIEDAFRSLEAEFELIVAEGAGSPAEINLWDADVANMRVAELAHATVLLVADIDRGGAFAHLFGTWSLLPVRQHALIRGFILNKFRGDPALLDPAPAQLGEMTGIPTLGLIPYLAHGLPDEDGAAPVGTLRPFPGKVVAVIRYPTASNLDEFKPLERAGRLRWAWTPSETSDADLVVLPGSKHVAADLGWLREHGFADAIRARVAQGLPVVGICGGLQMLGGRIDDPAGVDGEAMGLGVLPLATQFRADKITRPATACFSALSGPWAALSGVCFSGYEIRHGRTTMTGRVAAAIEGGLGYVSGAVLAVYVHGVFESPEVLDALFGVEDRATLDESLDELADAIEASVDLRAIEALFRV
jgi:adenosylcobyric acid synthase